MWLDLHGIVQEGSVDWGERLYSVRVFEDGFTEIRYESKFSSPKTCRGETLEKALLKAKMLGMTDSTWLAIRHRLRDKIGVYQKWVAEMKSVAKVPMPDISLEEQREQDS